MMKSGANLVISAKKLLLSLALASGVLAATPAVHAGTVSGNAEVAVVTSNSLLNTVPLDFGRILTGNTASRVTINANTGAITRDTGNATLAGGTVSRARFETAMSLPLAIVTVNMPTGPATLTRAGGTETMLVTNFQQDGSNIRLILFNRLIFHVGATLNVNANQAAGHYVGTFDVVTSLP